MSVHNDKMNNMNNINTDYTSINDSPKDDFIENKDISTPS